MLHLLFQLDAGRYALPARDVREVLPLVSTRPLQGAPPAFVGILNYRGQAVPVLDLALLLLGRPSAARVSTRLLIVDRPAAKEAGQLLGVIAERATGLVAKSPADFRPVDVVVPGARSLGPVAQDAEGMIQRLDLAALLAAAGRPGWAPWYETPGAVAVTTSR